MRRVAWLAIVGTALALPACCCGTKDSGSGASSQDDTVAAAEQEDPSPEPARTVTPRAGNTAQPARPPQPEEPEEPAAPAPIPGVVSEVPAIPAGQSNPPQGNEWDMGQEVNTQGANSRPDWCSMRVLREWVNVTCRADNIRGVEEEEGFGRWQVDWFKQVTGSYVSYVFRAKKGAEIKTRICRHDGKGAALFMYWPAGRDRPKFLALGNSSKCGG